MSTPSHLAEELRRIPRQRRGERRVAKLLDAAAAEIAAVGYQAATMSAIAARAGAPIGSLYQFFPNKQAVAYALRIEYGKDYTESLAALETKAQHLTLEDLVRELVNSSIGFVESHPAFLPLLDAPSSAARNLCPLRATMRERLAACFASIYPGVPRSKLMLLAAVTLQLLKGLNQLYAEAGYDARQEYVREYKFVLSCFLRARLEHSPGSEGQ